MHRQFIAQILESHAAGTIDLQVAVQLAVVARFYERLGDHAVNVGNRVRYIATGRAAGARAGAQRLQDRAAVDTEGADDVDRSSSRRRRDR